MELVHKLDFWEFYKFIKRKNFLFFEKRGCMSSEVGVAYKTNGFFCIYIYKTPTPKCRLYWCLIEFIDWRNSQSRWLELNLSLVSFQYWLLTAWYPPPFLYAPGCYSWAPPSPFTYTPLCDSWVPRPLAPDAINDVEKIKLSVKMFIVAGDPESPFFNPLYIWPVRFRKQILKSWCSKQYKLLYFYCSQ
jgi:hypothetical protein